MSNARAYIISHGDQKFVAHIPVAWYFTTNVTIMMIIIVIIITIRIKCELCGFSHLQLDCADCTKRNDGPLYNKEIINKSRALNAARRTRRVGRSYFTHMYMVNGTLFHSITCVMHEIVYIIIFDCC